MPKIAVEGFGVIEVPTGTRLVRALEDNGVGLLHRCGGNARCTTCRVAFSEGEPDVMTQAEYDRLEAKGLLGEARLSCQIEVTHDMKLKVLQLFEDSGLDDPGPQPQETITPEPVWIEKP